MNNMVCLGIDIGGRSVKVAARDGARWLWTGQSATYERPDAATVLAAIRSAITGNLDRIDALGMCVPGLLDVQRRVVLEAFNVPGLENVPLDRLARDAVDGRLTTPPSIHNDTAAAAHDVFVQRKLSGRLLVLALGTGVGAAVLDDGVPLLVEGQTAGHLGQIDVTVPGHDITAPDGGGGGLEGYIGTGALAQQYGPDVSAALTRFTGDEPAIAALVHTIRIAHALYRPHHIVLAGGIGIRLNHVLTVIRQRVAHRLTSAARAGWTITCGDDDFHAARGTALLAESEAASRAAATNAAAAYAQLVERRSA
jgi:glucokinase